MLSCGKMRVYPFWVFPVMSVVIWTATLFAMLGWWCKIGRPHYSSMELNQTVAFISDIGAQHLKPLFITGSCITTVSLDLSILSERWFHSQKSIVEKKSRLNKIFAVLSIGAAVVGTLGLVLLSILDVVHYKTIHQTLLIVAIVGYLVSAIFLCAERRSLGKNINQHRLLSLAFYFKIGFIVLEVGAGCGFCICFERYNNAAGILEWIIAFLFVVLGVALLVDLLPGANRSAKDEELPMEEQGVSRIAYSNSTK